MEQKLPEPSQDQHPNFPPSNLHNSQVTEHQIPVSQNRRNPNSDDDILPEEKHWNELIKFINSHTNKYKQEFQQEGRVDIEEINFAWLKLGWELGYYVGRVRLPRLQKISLTDNNIGAVGAEYFANSQLPNVKVIDLRNNNLQCSGIKHISSASWPKLEHLLLNCNNLTGNGFYQIRKANWFNIKQLNLSGNKLGSQGIASLSKMNMVFLRTLDVGSCRLGVEAVRKIVDANWPDLILLNLTMNNIKDEGVRLLAKSNWPKLQYIQIQFNNIRSGLRLLEARWPDLKFPYLFGNRATVEMIQETALKLIPTVQTTL